MIRLLAAVALVIGCRAAVASRPCLPCLPPPLPPSRPCLPCLPPPLPRALPASCAVCRCLCACTANRAKCRAKARAGRLCRPRRAAHGYQLAPSCSCGGAYNLVANTVAQRYTEQQQQQQQQQQQYGPPSQQYSGSPPQQQQFNYGPPAAAQWPTPCRCDCGRYAGGGGVAGVPTVAGLVVQQPAAERVGPATSIETPSPLMQNPTEFGTRTYEEEPEGGRVCEDCGGAPSPPSTRVMSIPPRGYAPPASNAVAPARPQQRYDAGRYAPPQPQPQPQPQPGPMYASCPAAVLYPAPSLLYTPMVAAPLVQPMAQQRYAPAGAAPAGYRPRRPSPPTAPAPPRATKEDDDDGLLKTFTIHSASDPVDLNSVAAAVAAAPAAAPKSAPGPKPPGDCSLTARPPTGK